MAERGLLSLDDTVDMYIHAFKDVKIVDAAGNESAVKFEQAVYTAFAI